MPIYVDATELKMRAMGASASLVSQSKNLRLKGKVKAARRLEARAAALRDLANLALDIEVAANNPPIIAASEAAGQDA